MFKLNNLTFNCQNAGSERKAWFVTAASCSIWFQQIDCKLLAGQRVLISGRLTLLSATPNASVFIRQMLIAPLCSGGSGDTCYLAVLWAPHIVTDVKARQGPLLAEPNANDFAKVCLLLSITVCHDPAHPEHVVSILLCTDGQTSLYPCMFFS